MVEDTTVGGLAGALMGYLYADQKLDLAEDDKTTRALCALAGGAAGWLGGRLLEIAEGFADMID